MPNDDIYQKSLSKKAPRAPVHHSPISEHFEGNFPLFLNRWEEGFDLREHDHAYLEVVYVMSGEGYHYVGDQVERSSKGCLYILPVGTSHIMRPSSVSGKNRLIVYNLCILPEFLSELQVWLSRYGDNGEVLSLYEGNPGTHISLVDQEMGLGPWFEHMYREFTSKDIGYETSIFAGLMQLTVRIARLLKASSKAGDVQAGRPGRPVMASLLGYIDRHATSSLTVEQLAENAGMSKRHFIRLFRQYTGMGFSDYIQHRRIEYACKLLLETDDKIAPIAKSAGYRDTSHFREVFRKLMGTSPHKYRAARTTVTAGQGDVIVPQ